MTLNFLLIAFIAGESSDNLSFDVSTWGLLKDSHLSNERHLKELAKRYDHDLEIKLSYVDVFIKQESDSQILCEAFTYDENNFVFYAIGDYNLLSKVLCKGKNSTFKLSYLLEYSSNDMLVYRDWRTKIFKYVGRNVTTLKYIRDLKSEKDERHKIICQSKQNMFSLMKSLARTFPKRTKDPYWFGNFSNVPSYFDAFCEVLRLVHDGDFEFSSGRYLKYCRCKSYKIATKYGKKRLYNLFEDNAVDFNELMSLINVVKDIEDICKTMPLDINIESPMTILKVVCVKLSDYGSDWLYKNTDRLYIKYLNYAQDEIEIKEILPVIVNDLICLSYDDLFDNRVHYIQVCIEDKRTPVINLLDYEFY